MNCFPDPIHQVYCPETGMFCQFMDPSGYCIATNCQHIWDLIEQSRIEEQASVNDERLWAMLDLLNSKEEEEIYGSGSVFTDRELE